MDKFDRYYKSRKLNINKNLINTYVKYDDKTLLISNGYSVVYTKTIRNDFKENKLYESSLNKFYDNFNYKASYCDKKNIKFDELKNNLVDNHYKINNDFSIDYTQLNKIIDIIGIKDMNIIFDDTMFIEIIGKNNQVGYLLPCRVY